LNWRKKPLEVTHMGNFKFHKAHFLCTTNSRRRVSLGRYVHTVGDTYKDDDWVFWASRATLVEEALSLSLLSSLPLRSHHRHSLLSIFRCLFLRDLHAVVTAETSPVYSDTDLLDSYFMHCLVDNALLSGCSRDEVLLAVNRAALLGI
jgi:hypothetical protein